MLLNEQESDPSSANDQWAIHHTFRPETAEIKL